MLEELFNIANKLDCMGLVKEADYLDSVIKKYADDLDYSEETQRSLETSINVDDMQQANERIKELDALVESKFDRGNFLQEEISKLSSNPDSSGELLRKLEEYSDELRALDEEVTPLLSELVNLSFSQGRILGLLRGAAGLSDVRDVEDLIAKIERGEAQYDWGVSNIMGDPSERIKAEASKSE
jgi:uncharacterized protein with von Willebrand factor type A (vWA) domain